MAAFDDPDESIGPLATVLANPRRRVCVRFLEAHDSATIGELATTISDIERNGENTTSYSRKSVYNSLKKNHVSTFVDANVCTFSDSDNTLHQGERFTACAAMLACMDGYYD